MEIYFKAARSLQPIIKYNSNDVCREYDGDGIENHAGVKRESF